MTDNKTKRSVHQWLFPVIWVLVAFKTLLPWLVFFRLTFEGQSYQWGSTLFGRMFYSAGLSRPDFLLVYFLLAAGMFLLYQLRSSNFRIAAPALLVYFGVFAADALYNLMLGEPFIFQGDTLGVRVDVSIPFFLFHFAAFAVVVTWWRSAGHMASGRLGNHMSRSQKLVAGICAAFVPVQLGLLMLGEPHGTSDAVGVVGTLMQWVLLAWAFYPRSDR